MKIDFNKDEYKALLDMLYISDWIIHSHLLEDESEHTPQNKLRKKLYACHEQIPLNECLERSEDNEYIETKSYEETLQKNYIEPYNERNFWDELTHRLAVRDLINEVGINDFQAMKPIERFSQLEPICEKYTELFEKKGIDAVYIKEDDSI